MSPLLKLVFKHYNISHSIMVVEKWDKTVYSILISFEPKTIYYLTPEETSSLANFNVYSDDQIKLSDIWFITEDEMPLLRFFHSHNELDMWVVNESRRILDEELNK
jgi:hypothetical protein